MPTDFGKRYRPALASAANIRILTNANCTFIHLDDNGRSVKNLAVRTLSGDRFNVQARQFVLAVGGLETPRLLLASNDRLQSGVGNAYDVVGRYYMCHIAASVGQLTLAGTPERITHGYVRSFEGVYLRHRLTLRPAEQRRLRVGNLAARLHFPDVPDASHRSGVLSALFLSRHLISYEYRKRLSVNTAGSASAYLEHVRNVLLDPIDTVGFFAFWLRKRYMASRKFPSVILKNRTNCFSLDIHAEQVPSRASRITLGASTDELGLPRILVDWRYSRQDIDTVERSIATFAEEFKRTGAGTLTYDATRLETDLLRFGAYGGHHIGTTRMGTCPKTSVVDSNCRVHGVSNLHIAGSSVFPTSSQANPTLTVVALTLRLADHLKLLSSR